MSQAARTDERDWDRTGDLALWTALAAGPVSFGLDLGISYALVQWSCTTGQVWALHAVTACAIAATGLGMLLGWSCLHRLPADASLLGGRAVDRARFMAVASLLLGAFFLLVVAANAVPRWVLSPCSS